MKKKISLDHWRQIMDSSRALKIRAVLAVLTMGFIASAMLILSPTSTESVSAAPAATHLVAHLGVSAAVAYKILEAVKSPWSWALGLVLVPIGFGGWALTLRLLWASVSARLGTAAAVGAFTSY
jgi:hypothetical protein